MESENTEKVYVAIGTDWHDGFSTLQWTLKKWCDQRISIAIIHAPNHICKDYVYTPLCKLPTSSVSEEKLKVLDKTEEAKSDKILSHFISFCGRVKVEVIKIEKNEQQPLHKQIIDTISTRRITKLVMSFAFIKSSSWKSRSAISDSFYILRQKPDFCEMFVVCGGRQVSLREENDEGLIEDERGFMVAKLKEKNSSIKNWLVKMFPENNNNNANKSPGSPSSSRSNGSPNQWEKCSQEIEKYANELLSCMHQEEGLQINVEKEILKENNHSTDLHMLETMDAAERIQVLKSRIQNAQDAVQSNKKQTIAAKERREKAEWAIGICNTRAEELEASINEQVMKNVDLNKDLDIKMEEINELESEVDEKRSKLNSILELQKELSKKLHQSSSAKKRAEVRLEKIVRERADTVQEIEELRKHRDVLQRRIEFCKEKDAIGKMKKLANGFDIREFSASEIIAATEDFSERLRVKSGGRSTNVYKGRINHVTVAIKMYKSTNVGDFTDKVKFISQIRHPNVLAMIGFCSELRCIVYEYMHNGSLHEALFSTERNSKRTNVSLSWHARVRIATEICSALSFLHKAKPNPIIHCNLNPSKVLLGKNNVAKINGLEGLWRSLCDEQLDIKLDIRAFGKLVLQLASGKNRDVTMDGDGRVLDHLCGIAERCLSENEFTTEMPVREIDDVKKRADEIIGKDSFHVQVEEAIDTSNVPSAFLCPIYQDVMQNPHVAADGFSYELEAIQEWVSTGHDTSPMTNLRLKHNLLTPNHTLRSLIHDWQIKRSATAIPT